VRLLGQIGRRGYDVLGVQADLSEDQKSFDVLVEFVPIMPVPPAVQEARPADVLASLVAKLVEVEKVELRTPVPKPKSTPKTPAAKSGGGEMHWEE
jgi:acetolactate synthase regulatory subunit